MPTLTKDRRNRWRGVVKIQGKVVETRLFEAGKKHGAEWLKAKRWEEERREEILAESLNPSAPAPRLLALVVSFLEQEKRRRAEKTFVEKRAAMNKLLAVAGDMLLSDMTPTWALAYLQGQFDARSGYAANKDRKNLSTMWDWGRRYVEGFPLELPNPFQGVERFREERKPRYVPTPEDFQAVYDQAEGQDRVMLAALYWLAGRKDEIFRLKWSDVDFEAQRVRLWHQKTGGKGWVSHWLPMLPELQAAMTWWFANRPSMDAEHVFLCLDVGDAKAHPWEGKPFVSRQKLMGRLCGKAGVQVFDFHAIRHLRAVVLYQAGTKLAAIQKWLRHESAATTEAYLKRRGLDIDGLRESVELTGKGTAAEFEPAAKTKARAATPAFEVTPRTHSGVH